jgi:alkylated DNA nucleotide flippase Atl1
MTYGQVAAAAGFPGAARLTVWALHRAERLPWHRVVAAGGRIALPGLEGQEQRLRLEIEGVRFRGRRVRMDLHNWIPRNRVHRDDANPIRVNGAVALPPGETWRRVRKDPRHSPMPLSRPGSALGARES